MLVSSVRGANEDHACADAASVAGSAARGWVQAAAGARPCALSLWVALVRLVRSLSLPRRAAATLLTHEPLSTFGLLRAG